MCQQNRSTMSSIIMQLILALNLLGSPANNSSYTQQVVKNGDTATEQCGIVIIDGDELARKH